MAIVILTDVDEDAVVAWTKENCPSFLGWMVCDGHDNRDLTGYLIRFEFEFFDEQDAMFFRLKWDGQ